MILFVICLVVALIGLAVAVGGRLLINPTTDRRYDDGPSRGVVVGIGLAIVAVAAVVTVFNSFTTIPVRTVGIELSFGKPVGLLNNGIHWVAPWHNIDKEWDGSVQTEHFKVQVRLANQTIATAEGTLQWNLHPSADVLTLYGSYKTFSNVQDNLVDKRLQAALNDEFGTYDPLRAGPAPAADGNATATGSQGQANEQLAAAAKDRLQKAVGDAIQVDTLLVPVVHFDGPTEARLTQYQQSIANTRIAQQDQETAKIQKATNDLLAQSASTKDPGVLAQNCVALIKELAAKDQLKDLPVNALAFCGGGGGGVPVIVGQK